MGRGQTENSISHGQTLRLLERIGLRADSLKTQILCITQYGARDTQELISMVICFVSFNCTYKYLIIFLFIVLKCIEDKTACPMYSTALFSTAPYLAALYSAQGSTQLHGSDMLLCLSPSQRTKSSRDLKGGALCKYTIIYLTNFNHATNVTLYDGQHD